MGRREMAFCTRTARTADGFPPSASMTTSSSSWTSVWGGREQRRVPPRPAGGRPAYTGWRSRSWTTMPREYATLKPWQYCGSIYGVVAADKGATRKPNEWQHYRIEARGPRVTVTLNGRLIVDADLIAHMDKESTHPGLKRRSGFIGLQCHGDRVEYRNITLKEFEWSESHDGN